MKSLFRWKRLVVSIVTVFSLMIGVAEAAYAENMETYVEETSFDENDVYEDMVTYSKLDTIENTWQGSNIHILKGQKYRFGQVGIFIWNGWNRCITMDSNRNLIALEIGTSSLRLACNGEVGLYTVNVVASGKTVVDVENKTITIAKGKKMSIPGQFKYTIEAASDAEGKEITGKKNFK